MPIFNYKETISQIQNTERGTERNMYAYLRALFAHTLGHPQEKIILDTPQKEGGGIPDLVVRCDTGVVDAKERAIYYDWIVAEAKDEGGVFLDKTKREEIFDEKQKYIRPQTEWFVMIDPQCIVVRSVSVRQKIKANSDLVLLWKDLSTAEKFRQALHPLAAESAADSPALKAFREGDESRIAAVRVSVPDDEQAGLTNKQQAQLIQARKDFLEVVRESTKMLQNACRWALHDWAKIIAEIAPKRDEFSKKWGGYNITYDPLEIKGKNRLESKEEFEEHRAQRLALLKLFRKNPAAAKLALTGLPSHWERNGGTSNEPFTIETANLILARILLLRFFEDHNFFGSKKYVCNGGVVILQNFVQQGGNSYTAVLREAYEKGRGIYPEAFDQTDFDWVLKSDNKSVSTAIELTMMLLSRFDFSTISGDILTGIYDRFLDREQRKAMGEFYTPPSVARYIVNKLDIKPTDSVFDPACGSGTFLLEAFEKMTKGDIRGGRGNYKQAAKALENIGGNDINPFSAVITQIQTLWHLLPLKSELKETGFPEIQISGGANSIAESGNLQGENYIYSALNNPVHSAVIGNPPYIRPERRGEIDMETGGFYKEIGGAKKDFYNLFVYKALTQWCRKENGNHAAGRLGFVLPLGFCNSGKSKSLRELFAPGGKFRILEIVDMEAIAPLVFDAAVIPIVLLAENRPATAKDKITLRIAGEESVVGNGEFNLNAAPHDKFKYADVFSKDGRILTKLAAQRKLIIDKMRETKSMLADIARVYWVGKDGNHIKDWRLTPPADNGLMHNGDSDLRYEKEYMYAEGAASRRKKETAKNGQGLDYYKGENISACRIEGEPAIKNLLPDSLSTPSLWRYRKILPEVGYAFLGITLGITAARFNPRQYAFLNTAVLLFPNEKWENFPLDAALSSRIYQFYYGCYLREGAMSHSWRSRLYIHTLEQIPLPPALLKDGAKLEKLREKFLSLCEKINQRAETIDKFLAEVENIPLRDACRDADLAMLWSEGFQNGNAAEINAPTIDSIQVENNRLLLSGEWLEIQDADILRRAAAALVAQHGRELKREHLQKLPIPFNEKALKDFAEKLRRYDSGEYEKELENVLSNIDAIVGAAFNLPKKDIADVQKTMKEDGFLRNIRPNMPFVERRRKGLSDKLASSARYVRKKS